MLLRLETEDMPSILDQMKKGSYISTKIKIALTDSNFVDKFSLSGFTKNLNKALSMDKRRFSGSDLGSKGQLSGGLNK